MRALVGAEREVADQERRSQSAAHRPGQHQHLLDRDRGCRRVAEDRHRGGVAGEHQIHARLLGYLCRGKVVGGDHHDRLALPLLLRQQRQGDRLTG
jgi:hypothetical protein